MARSEVKCHVTGAVWKVEVAEGQAVDAGQTLILIESMKMEIPVVGTRAGRVTRILVEEGDVVEEGQALVVLEV